MFRANRGEDGAQEEPEMSRTVVMDQWHEGRQLQINVLLEPDDGKCVNFTARNFLSLTYDSLAIPLLNARFVFYFLSTSFENLDRRSETRCLTKGNTRTTRVPIYYPLLYISLA